MCGRLDVISCNTALYFLLLVLRVFRGLLGQLWLPQGAELRAQLFPADVPAMTLHAPRLLYQHSLSLLVFQIPPPPHDFMLVDFICEYAKSLGYHAVVRWITSIIIIIVIRNVFPWEPGQVLLIRMLTIRAFPLKQVYGHLCVSLKRCQFQAWCFVASSPASPFRLLRVRVEKRKVPYACHLQKGTCMC